MSNKGSNTVTLLAGGDIGAKSEPTDRFTEFVLPVLRDADLRFAQCERLYTERPFVPPHPDAHSGPHPHHKRPLPVHPRLASIWKTAGIDIVSVASNHTMDWGPEMLLDTVELFRSMGMHPIGVGRDIDEARKPAIVERNGVRIAFLGYCSVLADGHEAGKGKVGAAPMRARTYYERSGDPHEDFQPGTPPKILTIPYEEDLKALQEDIRKAKLQADVVVMSIHWGVHHIPKHIATYQPVVAHAAIDAGADLILGHHAHCLKAVEVYKGKVCFYCIGNFMNDAFRASWPAEGNACWDFYYYEVDPECLRPDMPNLHVPRDNRKTMLAKAVFSKKGVERVSFLPAFIDPDAKPAVVPPGDPKFQEILKYMEWVSEQYPHKFRVEGNEVVVDTSS